MRRLHRSSSFNRSLSDMPRCRPLFGLVALLSLLTPGCVFTPAKSPEIRSAQIGDDAAARVRIRVTTRDETLSMFGKPSYSTKRDLAVGYLWTVETGTLTGL